MAHDHGTATADRRTLLTVFGLTAAFMLIEAVVGVLTGSLSLVADAIHMFTDAGALALAAFASWMAEKPATPQRTFGYYRVEILAAAVNAVVLLGSALYIVVEAVERLQNPTEVTGLPMMVVAAIGLGVNLIGVWLLRERAGENLNVQGAFYEVVKDALGSVGVIIAGLVILLTGWTPIDPIMSVAIALFILPRTWHLLKEATNVLLEATPASVSLPAVRETMLAAPGVEEVHDLHVWTITSGFVAMSGHVVVDETVGRDGAQRIVETLKQKLHDAFEIEHTTIQVEYENICEDGCD